MEYKAWECCSDIPAQTHENGMSQRANDKDKDNGKTIKRKKSTLVVHCRHINVLFMYGQEVRKELVHIFTLI